MAMGHGVVEGVLGALQGNVIPIGDRCPDAIAATAIDGTINFEGKTGHITTNDIGVWIRMRY